MSWSHVQQAKDENRHELLLSGEELSKCLQSSSGILDETIFNLVQLNFLRLSSSIMCELSSNIGKLNNLTNLELQNNSLETLPDSFSTLKKLKLLDISDNKLRILPDSVNDLSSLSSINGHGNALEEVPSFEHCSQLAHIDLRGNMINCFSDLCHKGLGNLSELLLATNCIEEISDEISCLSSLKTIDLSNNQINVVPSSILECSKLKDLSLRGNKLSDRRFGKLVESDRCQPKQVMDYLLKNNKGASKGGDKKNKKAKNVVEADVNMLCDRLKVLAAKDELSITITPSVKGVRGFIVCCIVRGLDLSGTKMKKFIAAQAKLHDSVCDKRVSATIASHDLSTLTFPLCYTAKERGTIMIQPLGRTKAVKAASFFRTLQIEAETLRKQMKRNTYSGIHKYIHLVEDWEKWPILEDSNGVVLSFPPITNSEQTKISQETNAVLLEVTSGSTMGKAKEVMEALLKAILECEIAIEKTEKGRSILDIEQVRILEEEDRALRTVFPSRLDLVVPELWDKSVEIIRG